MSYHYKASVEERAATRVLKRKGWTVSEPQCPDCHGFGIVGKIDDWGAGETKSMSYSSILCPRGCPTPAMYLRSRSARVRG